MTQAGQDKIHQFLTVGDTHEVRLKACEFRDLLLGNDALIIKGNVRHFQGIHIGEGVYRVKLLPVGWDSYWGNVKLGEGDDWIVKNEKIQPKKPACNCN